MGEKNKKIINLPWGKVENSSGFVRAQQSVQKVRSLPKLRSYQLSGSPLFFSQLSGSPVVQCPVVQCPVVWLSDCPVSGVRLFGCPVNWVFWVSGVQLFRVRCPVSSVRCPVSSCPVLNSGSSSLRSLRWGLAQSLKF